ncbi:hypothetical protein J2S19_000564 [Metabacillus malikii]|uniref:Uncharacterized protein n=2 Tax=Metabacillus malikii TaxID=1504265 RepID=A0ABT9ZAP3_9BACI|nr:hypothetical protein [Metabacillus malikii]
MKVIAEAGLEREKISTSQMKIKTITGLKKKILTTWMKTKIIMELERKGLH